MLTPAAKAAKHRRAKDTKQRETLWIANGRSCPSGFVRRGEQSVSRTGAPAPGPTTEQDVSRTGASLPCPATRQQFPRDWAHDWDNHQYRDSWEGTWSEHQAGDSWGSSHRETSGWRQEDEGHHDRDVPQWFSHTFFQSLNLDQLVNSLHRGEESFTAATGLEVEPGESLADAAQSGVIGLRSFRKAEEALFHQFGLRPRVISSDS